MEDIAISIAAKVVEYLVAPIVQPIARPFSYIWNYKTNFDNLKTEVRKLQERSETVLHSIEVARGNGDQIVKHVSNWLDRVKTVTDEASDVIEENERANMKCFKGLCPNPKKRYQHSRNAAKKAKAIVDLYAEGNFETVSFRTIPEETWIPSHIGYEAFESRMSTLKKILDALSNPDVNMVGIYGAGGIGKTTLVRAIAGQVALDKKLFNVVAFVVVAREGLTFHEIQKEIQKDIAGKLGLTFTSEEGVTVRASRLQARLKQEEKVLLVLDNIWERLNLEEVGIPFGNDHKGCKLLLTARSRDVLSEMDCHHHFIFQIDVLDKGEAWSLFKKRACIENNDCLQALARKVAEACGGFPIAIISVAVALKNKKEFEWEDALEKLTTSSESNFEGVTGKTYSSIEISYSQLKEKQLKSTFLLCCKMEYTGLVALLEYGMGLGIFEDVNTMEKARNRMNTLVRKLKDSSLLLDINNGTFSLHDVVRDVGRSIASRDGHMFIVANNYIPREWVDKDILKNCVGISLYNISKLPEEFECPELQFFYLITTSEDYSRVPDNFFAGMPKLKVLHLAGLELYLVPNSIRLLVNLRTLYIDNCKLRDIDFIGEFKQLEILRIRSLFFSEIEMIPKKMRNLTGLRLLDLNDCDCLRNISSNVLSTFTQLEELYLPAIQWEVEGVNILDELKHLKHLTALEISIPDDSVLPKGRLVSNKLERYNIIIGDCEWHGTSRMVQLNLETSSCSDDVQKFLSLLDREGFPELEYLHVQNSPCFRTVVDCLESESCHHFLFLQSLSLYSVLNLEMIHNYPLKADSFRQLRTITVENCNKLKNILSFSTCRALPLLQEVNVSSCDNMEEIFAINRREEDINNDEGTDQIEFKHLSSLTLTSLPKLTSFCSINNNKDMFDTPTLIFNQKVAFSSSEEIEISEMDDLETIWPHQLCNDSFCNLKSLNVTRCNKLSTIFQSNMIERITRLESLTLCDCDLVEKIFDLQDLDFEESHFEVETRLRELVIKRLPNLKHIWNKDPQKMFSFQKLNYVKVRHCMSLKYLFPVSIAESLSELEKLDVYNCGVEEFVVDDQGEFAATFVFPRITSLEFNQLPRLKTFYRGVHTSQWQNLKRLTMCGCDKVELFASELFNFQENNEGQYGSSVQPLFIVEKVTFPSLEEIKISKSNNLKILWQKGAKESFCNLKSVEVSCCNELLTFFQFNTLKGLSMPKLLTVTISNCASVEEIFDLQKVNLEESHSRAVMYDQLQQLNINRLPKLKHVWKKDPQAKLSFEELPMPESLRVSECDSIELIFDLQKVNFDESHSRPVTNQLKELYISGLPKLKHIWKKDPQAGLSFEELPMPESLTVNDCDSIEEIFDLQKVNFEESHSRQVTNRLQELDIRRLPKLKHIWKKDPQAELSFEELPMPESLRVSDCDSIEEIFDLQKVNFEESHYRPVTYRLQNLDINLLPKLKHIWKKDPQAELSSEELPMPESLRVSECDSIEEIFDLQKVNFEESHSRPVTNQLQELYISGLPKLKHIWNKDPQAELSFENLQEVKVFNCQSLKDIFPASIARSLLQLVHLNVYRCGKLEEIVAKEGEANGAARFVFLKVTSIRLDRLPQLRTFYRGVHSSKWEVLKELEVVGCDKIGLLASQLSCFQENNIDISVQPPFFLVEKDSFPILEKLILIGGGAQMISQGQFSEELFCNLKFLQVYDDKSVVLFPLRILQRFHHLHELHLKSSSCKEIFSYEEDETHVGVDSKLDMILSKLERLTVGDCQNLIQLVPSSTSFQNLTVLKVCSCHGLKNLMTSSTAKKLVQLREMAIGRCWSMVEVVAKGGDVTEDKIIFSKLRTLRLGDLPSLSCFSENYTFELPSLEEIIVFRCPEMKYFSLRDMTTRILQKVRRGSMKYTLEGDLNTTIQKTHNSRVDDSWDPEMEYYFRNPMYTEI